jgi:hypothetical protein
VSVILEVPEDLRVELVERYEAPVLVVSTFVDEELEVEFTLTLD